jgi:hypothetical protein
VIAQRVSKAIPSDFETYESTLYGVLVHGAEGFFGYAVDGACGGGSNTTVECISRTLQKLAAIPERQSNWPKVLFLQVDGCIGDNKNRTLFGYAGWLVAQGNFKEVHINFLLVGHTHEDIDAIFGVISKFFKGLHAAIITLTELMMTVFNALTQRTDHMFTATHPMEHMRTAHDWSSFLIGPKQDPNLRTFTNFAKMVNIYNALLPTALSLLLASLSLLPSRCCLMSSLCHCLLPCRSAAHRLLPFRCVAHRLLPCCCGAHRLLPG